MIPEPRDGSVVLAGARKPSAWQRMDQWASMDAPAERWFPVGWTDPAAFGDLINPVLIHEGKPV